jgi:uncharacterized protein (DUF433 family)
MELLEGYNYIGTDPDMLGGQPVVVGTRLSAAFILSCLAEEMSDQEIAETYVPVPHEAILEVLKLAAEVLDGRRVAA